MGTCYVISLPDDGGNAKIGIGTSSLKEGCTEDRAHKLGELGVYEKGEVVSISVSLLFVT
jgi:hypothetical protein